MLKRHDLLDVVTSDLAFLRDEWDEEVDDHSLRRSSTILRRLLVDNELQRAWKAAGFEKEPILESSTLDPVIGRIPRNKITFASAGGARYRGGEARGALYASIALSQQQIEEIFAAGLPSRSTGLREFIEAPCIIARGRPIPRRVLVKYVSNKLGGAHHDPKRGNNEEEISFARLDEVDVMLLEKPAVYFELLSAGQALVKSTDIQKLIVVGAA